MNRARAFLLAAVGLAIPAGLALAVYLTSAGPLAAVPAVVSVPSEQIARPAATTTERQSTTSTQASTTTTTTTEESHDDRAEEREDERLDDLPGKCDDPDHRLDPDCDPRLAEEDHDSSGSGSGSDGDSSGKGSGDDD